MTPLSPDVTPRRLTESRLSPIAADPIRTVSKSPSAESLGQAQSKASESKRCSVTVPPVKIVKPSEVRAPVPSRHDRHPEMTRDDSEITLKQDVYRPEQPVHGLAKEETAQYSDEKEIAYSDEKEVVVQQPEEDTRVREVSRAKEMQSPLLTGKDSAYSSISGASFASPTAGHPRSASSQSSYPRAQFGLFPSSSPGTPKHSTMSGRFGAMSPTLNSPMVPDNTYLPQRAQTSLSNHDPPPRRLLKKSSLSSLKRLFSKKKHGAVDTIVE
jgi:hypothetical protein